jgi:hypothetical protein
MSLDDRHDSQQLEGLAAELTEAGRVARAAFSRREIPDPAFAARLRAELMGEVEPGPEAGKRWRTRQVQTIVATRPVLAAMEPADLGADRAAHAGSLHPSVLWRMSTRVKPARWLAVGLAASVAIGGFLYGSTLLLPVRSEATASVAVATSLVRSGVSSELANGAPLHEGDEIKVAAGGQATLVMGASFVRMAPGSDVRLDSLTSNHVVVNQLSGRAYHRVAVGGSGDYEVVTGSVSWVASGTAFDLDRHAISTGEEVRGLALLDGLNLHDQQLQAALNQGQSAVVDLTVSGSTQRAPVIGQIDAQVLADSWLIQNAHLDAQAGLALGELAAAIGPTPLPSQTSVPIVARTAPPTVTPAARPTREPTPSPTPSPTRKPTPSPTRKPTPKPTPKPTGPLNLGKLTITNNGDGTYTFSWPKYKGTGFQYYKLLHGDAGTTPTYGLFDFWACNSDPAENSWRGTVPAGDYAVRLQVIDDSSAPAVIRAQTNVVHLKVNRSTPTLPPSQHLGALTVRRDGNGKYTFSWAPYTGGWRFDAYKLVYTTWPGSPSYLGGHVGYWAFGAGETSSGSIALPSGHWAFRVQAIGQPGGTGYEFARTAVVELVVP